MKKVFMIAAACVIVSMFASCAATRDSSCPSHDPNFFRKEYRR